MTAITFNQSLRDAQIAAEQAVYDAPREQRPSLWAPREAAQKAREEDVLSTLRANVATNGTLYRWSFEDGTSFKGRVAYVEGYEPFDSVGIIAVDEPRGNSARRRTFRADLLVKVEAI